MNGSFYGACLATAIAMHAACLPIEGDQIRADDLAKVIPAFAVAAGRMVSPAPLPGAQRHFSGAELRRLARRAGLEVGGDYSWPASLCFAYPTRRLTREEVVEAIRESGGADQPFELVGFSLFAVPAGKLTFRSVPLSSNASSHPLLLSGSVAYAGARRVPVWARIRVLARPRYLVARQDLDPGVPIDAANAVLTEAESHTAPGLRSLAEVQGFTVRRRVAAGTPLTRSMLTKVLDIDRGQQVRVRVQSGRASVSFESKAETGGRAGDMILLRNPESGSKFRAKVDGKSHATIALPAKEN